MCWLCSFSMCGKFDGEAGLLVAHDEAVREAAAVHAVQRAHAVRPLLGQADAVAADELVAGAPRVVGADLEAGGEDQAVELVLDAVDDDALSVMRSTPLPWVSTSVTFGRLNVSRYSSWKHGRLQNWR